MVHTTCAWGTITNALRKALFLPEGPKALEEDLERSGSGAPDMPNG